MYCKWRGIGVRVHKIFLIVQCREQCLQLDKVISSVQGNGLLKEQLFPVIVGRRPSSCGASSSKGSSSTSSSNNLKSLEDQPVVQSPPVVSSSLQPPFICGVDFFLRLTIFLLHILILILFFNK